MRIEFYDIDGEIQVWLEHDVKFSGLCIGFGATRAAAAECAAEFLRKKVDVVFTAADCADSGVPRTVNAEARDPHLSAASSAAPLPSEMFKEIATDIASERENRGFDSYCDRIRSALYAAYIAGQAAADPALRTLRWQSIESAPTDGTRLLLYGCEYRRHWFGHGYYFKGVPGDGEGWIAHSFYALPNNDSSGVFQPTHWMPMLDPPTAADLDRVCPEIRDEQNKPPTDPV